MTTAILIVAAGRGTRAGPGAPKQWRPLAGRRVIDWTLDAFLSTPGIGPVMVALHAEDIAGFVAPKGVLTCTGGATRAASVRAGLEALAPLTPDKVLIHDVARPCLSQSVIAAVVAALDQAPGAAPALPVTDALWRGVDGRVSGSANREGLFRAQTPQGFRFDAILAAHRSHVGEAADDVEVARAAGLEVVIVPGHEDNLKITHAPDFARAEQILRGTMDIRLGNGFDVHAFGPGDHVMLCGVAVPHDRGLKGHSDADVGMHAVTDALYGALAQGDIGRHFPPSDPQWKGAASHIFLAHATALAGDQGFTVSNVDVTLICERPKIGPLATAMQARIAEILALDPARVSVKATTTERLGFTGREEGIAALATATLIRP
ncbi:bifunctional 2-C-methyl-D-erythritol 4-phosphate cytidylyltransferase/2-C-methyl-D-erythritol 2,4-cyclodiphosphate synthase [Marimonas arenosa]|uniref:Bifunctional enzyme IspD/IspF n=1 Tax=Marimonas arenosa TaxID=1795305 RepID=A0AAE4B2Z6_9RHOB|nr:bifunctional 2-C-methyl-D-erythritol 4-phosphate cytidylyltransferase/2-C-methyl-D-erythritol 2,4-cyclodiphosphate synthase [Marimonas arenosa]MDQ2088760.1 bifunctional 2-C-methyl-D-erythritol 4-phosphate cytidylyltransferase/2-C-methyl-D-erythritol 2,4-cyclodiphosphate synthase [Marimonas arenosa]